MAQGNKTNRAERLNFSTIVRGGELLKEHFNTSQERFNDQWSDARIAKELDCSVVQAIKLRQQLGMHISQENRVPTYLELLKRVDVLEARFNTLCQNIGEKV